MPGRMRPPRVDNPHGPRKRTQHNRKRTKKHPGAGIQSAPPHQEAYTSKSQKDSSQKRRVQSPLPGGSGGEQENPDRLAGNKQRGQAGWDLLLRPRQRAVANQKKTNDNDKTRLDLLPSRPQALCQAP